jgi:hypothetical protein
MKSEGRKFEYGAFESANGVTIVGIIPDSINDTMKTLSIFWCDIVKT